MGKGCLQLAWHWLRFGLDFEAPGSRGGGSPGGLQLVRARLRGAGFAPYSAARRNGSADGSEKKSLRWDSMLPLVDLFGGWEHPPGRMDPGSHFVPFPLFV